MPIRPEQKALYPKNWAIISRWIRFTRAEGRCECNLECGLDHGTEHQHGRCTARHGEMHPRTGSLVVLTTMHLDHDPRNSANTNLMAACQQCHNRYDAPYRRAGIIARKPKPPLLVLIDGGKC